MKRKITLKRNVSCAEQKITYIEAQRKIRNFEIAKLAQKLPLPSSALLWLYLTIDSTLACHK